MTFELTDQSTNQLTDIRTSQSLAVSLVRIKTGGKQQKRTEVVKELQGNRLKECRGVKGREIYNMRLPR